MFDIGWQELLVIAVILIVVVGPKDLPRMLRAFGKTTARMRSMAGDFRSQFDEALKEADLDDVRKTISDAQQYNPSRAIRDAMNPLRDVGEEIRAGLNDAIRPETVTETPEEDAEMLSSVENADTTETAQFDKQAGRAKSASRPRAKRASKPKTASSAKPGTKKASASRKTPGAKKTSTAGSSASRTDAKSSAAKGSKSSSAEAAVGAKIKGPASKTGTTVVKPASSAPNTPAPRRKSTSVAKKTAASKKTAVGKTATSRTAGSKAADTTDDT